MMSIQRSRPATNSVFVELLDRERVTNQHEAIYLAIEAGDPERAQAAFQNHVTYLHDTRRDALAEQDSSDVMVSSSPVRNSISDRPVS